MAELSCPRGSLRSPSCWELQNTAVESLRNPVNQRALPSSSEHVLQDPAKLQLSVDLINRGRSEKATAVKGQNLDLPMQSKAERNWVEQWLSLLRCPGPVLGYRWGAGVAPDAVRFSAAALLDFSQCLRSLFGGGVEWSDGNKWKILATKEYSS